MTKKKLVALILISVFVFYGCAMSANYTSSLTAVCDEADNWWTDVSHENLLSTFIDSGETDFSELHYNLNRANPIECTFLDLPYSYMVVDSEKNVIIQSGSTVWWRSGGNEPNYYIPLEQYMTPEIKSKILNFQKKALNERIKIKQMEVKLNSDTNVCIPVSVTFEDLKNNSIRIEFNDLRYDVILTPDKGMFVFVLYDLDEKSIEHKYYLEAQKVVKEEVDSYVFKSNYGGGGGYGNTGGGELDHHESFKGYLLVISSRYSSFYKTLTSYLFSVLFTETTVLFAVVGAVILIFAVKVFNKNQKIKENQRAFTSAVAHEMKTPLAVIQNQCECILDNVAPEKNEQYVRSVYDEAVKMNGMVQSFLMFNRLSDTENIKTHKCCLSEIIQNEIRKHESFASAKKMTFNADVQSDVFVNGNDELFSIAVGNYLSNAIRHSFDGTQIEVKLTADTKTFTFEVFNEAEPIDITNDIWSLLTKGDLSRGGSDGSSGMGLPVCKRIFELHKMEYGHKNEEHGIRFFFKGKTF